MRLTSDLKLTLCLRNDCYATTDSDRGVKGYGVKGWVGMMVPKATLQ